MRERNGKNKRTEVEGDPCKADTAALEARMPVLLREQAMQTLRVGGQEAAMLRLQRPRPRSMQVMHSRIAQRSAQQQASTRDWVSIVLCSVGSRKFEDRARSQGQEAFQAIGLAGERAGSCA